MLTAAHLAATTEDEGRETKTPVPKLPDTKTAILSTFLTKYFSDVEFDIEFDVELDIEFDHEFDAHFDLNLSKTDLKSYSELPLSSQSTDAGVERLSMLVRAPTPPLVTALMPAPMPARTPAPVPAPALASASAPTPALAPTSVGCRTGVADTGVAEILEHGCRHETLPKRVSNDSGRFVFRRQQKIFRRKFSFFANLAWFLTSHGRADL